MRVRIRAWLILTAALGLAPFAAARTGDTPALVSPGSTAGVSRIANPCPSFHWGAVDNAESYELVVYRVHGEAQDEGEGPLIQVTLPGSARGWTPPLEQCLRRGGRYAWTVRAMGPRDPGSWPEAALFQVASGATESELEEALEVVRSHLEQSRSQAASSAPIAPRTARAAPAAETRSQEAASGDPSLGSDPGFGIVVSGAPVETKADGPCYPSSRDVERNYRIVDCGNGTGLDTVTGTVWLLNVGCAGELDWWDAHEFAKGLSDGKCGLSDRSQRGDWKVASLESVERLIRDARDRLSCTGTPPCDVLPGGAPSLPNDPGDACQAAGPSSWRGVTAETVIWTSTKDETDPTKAFAVSLCTGMPTAVPAATLLLPYFEVSLNSTSDVPLE